MEEETIDEKEFRLSHAFSLENPVMSWSSKNTFDKDPEEWYQVYCKGKKIKSPALIFGKKVADSMGTKKPLAPFTRLSEIEHKFKVVFEGIPLVGSMDTFDPPKLFAMVYCVPGEFKTGSVAWTQKRANDHGQLKMYSFLLWLQLKIYPEQQRWFLEWGETEMGGDFIVRFVDGMEIKRFEVRLTTVEVLKFAGELKITHAKMIAFYKQKQIKENPLQVFSGFAKPQI